MKVTRPARRRGLIALLAAPVLLASWGCGSSTQSIASDEATTESVSKYEQAIAKSKASRPTKGARTR